MNTIRIDSLTGRPVMIASARAAVGRVGGPSGLPELGPRGCPFCPGREAESEEAIVTLGSPWHLRVVGNRYPLAASTFPDAPGAHEVIVESDRHDAELHSYSDEELQRLLEVWRERIRVQSSRSNIASVSVFRNRGRRAGSSQPHPHSQLVALEIVPPEVALRAKDHSVLTSEIERERRDEVRMIEAGSVLVFCPYASSRAWEVRLVPERPTPRFANVHDEDLIALARALGSIARRLRGVLGVHDFNVLVREPPIGKSDSFFTVDVLPRTGGDAGFELLSGIGVCVVAPEEAALALRSSNT